MFVRSATRLTSGATGITAALLRCAFSGRVLAVVDDGGDEHPVERVQKRAQYAPTLVNGETQSPVVVLGVQ